MREFANCAMLGSSPLALFCRRSGGMFSGGVSFDPFLLLLPREEGVTIPSVLSSTLLSRWAPELKGSVLPVIKKRKFLRLLRKLPESPLILLAKLIRRTRSSTLS